MFEPPSGAEDLVAQVDEIEKMEADVARRKAEIAKRSQPAVIDESGEELNDDGTPKAPPWPHDTIELEGKTVEIKKPPPAAIRYLGVFMNSKSGQQRGDFTAFMERHVSPKSVNEIREWSYSGEITENFYEELMKVLVTQGTARPTGPS